MTPRRLITVMIALTLISYLSGLIPLGNNYDRPVNNCLEVLDHVDQAPNFVGGEDALLKYLQQNVLPYLIRERDKDSGQTIQVQLRLLISTNGQVVDYSIDRNVSTKQEGQIARGIFDMPKWQPALKEKKPVCFNIFVPLVIILN